MTTSPARPTAAPTSPRRRVGLLAVVAIVALLSDQVTKAIALATLTPLERVPFLGDLLGWRLIFNPGAAFSFGTGATWVFTLVMAIVSIGILVFAPRVRSVWWAIALGALLGGAMGNLVDRLARPPGFGIGHVVDFIDYGVFIGNVADIAIVGAAVGMVLLSLVGIGWDATRARAAESDDGEASAAGTEAADGGRPAEPPAGAPAQPAASAPGADAESAPPAVAGSNGGRPA